MAIVTAFFDQQKAGEINAIINTNFNNVAKYIPVHFDTLGTVDRLNLGDDWKTEGKLVFDIDEDKVFIWNSDNLEWEEKLLSAKDIYARGICEELMRKAYCYVKFDNSTLIFSNATNEQVGTVEINADNIKYDGSHTIAQQIQEMLEKEREMQEDIIEIQTLLGNSDLTTEADTVTGAIAEMNAELKTDTKKLNDILDGTTYVPNATHATQADKADDADLLDGKDSTYFAEKAVVDELIPQVEANTGNITQNTQRIIDLESGLDDLNARVDVVDQTAQDALATAGDCVDRLDAFENVVGQGFQIVEDEYTITLETVSETYTTPALTDYDSTKDSIKLFMNGGYVLKSNYSIEVDPDSKVGTITNLNHATYPWVLGWELTILVTRIVTIPRTDPQEP